MAASLWATAASSAARVSSHPSRSSSHCPRGCFCTGWPDPPSGGQAPAPTQSSIYTRKKVRRRGGGRPKRIHGCVRSSRDELSRSGPGAVLGGGFAVAINHGVVGRRWGSRSRLREGTAIGSSEDKPPESGEEESRGVCGSRTCQSVILRSGLSPLCSTLNTAPTASSPGPDQGLCGGVVGGGGRGLHCDPRPGRGAGRGLANSQPPGERVGRDGGVVNLDPG